MRVLRYERTLNIQMFTVVTDILTLNIIILTITRFTEGPLTKAEV